MALRKSLLLALVRDLNERAITLLEKDFNTVIHETKQETKETGLETVESMLSQIIIFRGWIFVPAKPFYVHVRARGKSCT